MSAQNNARKPKESVWSYPRPPRIEPVVEQVRVIFGGETVADTKRALKVLETSHAPTYYIPREDVALQYLEPSRDKSLCEFKGEASYWSLRVGKLSSPDAVWSYEEPRGEFEAIQGYLAFYPARVDACYVGDEHVRPEDGDFYGGWITREIEGV
jgi:uncharacterized protein (DUF427 family)